MKFNVSKSIVKVIQHTRREESPWLIFPLLLWVHFEYKIAVSEYDGDISAGTYYAAETDPDRKVLSDLNPNIKVKDSAVFEISKTAYEAGGFTVCVDADKDFDVKIN